MNTNNANGEILQKMESLPEEAQEDIIKILGYVASMCLFLMALFAFIYTYHPSAVEDFTGFSPDFPLSGIFNGVLSFAVGSISNIFTYIILAVIGTISFFAARHLEYPGEGGLLLIKKEVASAVLETEPAVDSAEEDIPATDEPSVENGREDSEDIPQESDEVAVCGETAEITPASVEVEPVSVENSPEADIPEPIASEPETAKEEKPSVGLIVNETKLSDAPPAPVSGGNKKKIREIIRID